MKAIIAVPVTLAMIYRAWSHKSLTPAGIIAATFTAAAHAVHPWSLPFALLIVFFLAATKVTKVHHEIKEKLTMKSTGNSGGEGPRTHVQVFANSIVASTLCILHAYQLHQRALRDGPSPEPACFSWPGDILMVGIIANYAAVAADTFSSELGILSKSQPRLITSWNLRKVPPGTNGGVTAKGLGAGLLGSLVMVATTQLFLPFCAPPVQNLPGWNLRGRNRFAFAMAIWGTLGSVLDSILGGLLQQSVVDTRTGRIVEGEGGKTVLVSKDGPNSLHFKKRAEVKASILNGEGKSTVEQQPTAETTDARIEEELNKKMGGMDKLDVKERMKKPNFGSQKPSRIVESGSLGLLDNNEVNFVMALTMSLGAMGIASWFWDVPFSSIFSI